MSIVRSLSVAEEATRKDLGCSVQISFPDFFEYFTPDFTLHPENSSKQDNLQHETESSLSQSETEGGMFDQKPVRRLSHLD